MKYTIYVLLPQKMHYTKFEKIGHVVFKTVKNVQFLTHHTRRTTTDEKQLQQ